MATQPYAIDVKDLCKTYSVVQREEGLRAAARSFFRRTYTEVKAVDHVSFDVNTGEIVGFLGPNGAGKTSTLKCLTGLLYPSAGQASILGFEPQRREKAFLRQITLIMGQRFQLQWDLPALDSFRLFQTIYQIDDRSFRQIRDELIELLEITGLVSKPVRNLSLGERMKCELVAALLHKPRILFLDEPTLGLDVTMQRRIRTFIADYCRRYDATTLLTSHYMADIEALCKRAIIIHHGRLLFDGALSDLVERFTEHKTIQVTLKTPVSDLGRFGAIARVDGLKSTWRVPPTAVPAFTARLLAELPISDLIVEDPPLEEVIETVFAQSSPERLP